MPTPMSPTRKTIFAASVVVLSLAVSSPDALAMAHYRVWYFDDIHNGAFQEGDISDGTTKLIPPAWACGLLFDDPSTFRWIGQYGATIGSGDFWKDVRVWFPKAGCPESDPLIEYADGSKTFPHKPGGRYMEIATHFGARWIDEDGGYPSCSGCTGVGSFQYFPPYVGDVLFGSITTAKTALLVPHQQLFVPDTIADLEAEVRVLQASLQQRVEERRRYDLADRETSVRSLEDHARRRLADALQRLGSCQQVARGRYFADAYVACDLGAESVDAARSLLNTARYFFRDKTSKAIVR